MRHVHSFAIVHLCFSEEIRAFIGKHVDRYPDLKSRLALCHQLQTLGFAGEWMDKLRKDLTAELGGK